MDPRLAESHNRHDFFQHIKLPFKYVQRSAISSTLRDAILQPDIVSPGDARSRSTNILALHGMGGTGKSVIAREICEDVVVMSQFPDGILWATLGQSPNPKRLIGEWLNRLGHHVRNQSATLNILCEELAHVVRSRACLFIIDDVWRREHVEPFLVDNPNCTLLITTRNAALARQLGARVIHVGGMEISEAKKLVDIWSNGWFNASPAHLQDSVLAKLHGLPLALKLAGAQLQTTEAENWLSSFGDARTLSADWINDDRESSLAACFRLSIDDLGSASRFYLILGIFPEDELIPTHVIRRLWLALDQKVGADTDRLIQSLADRALLSLQRQGAVQACELHDFLRQMIRFAIRDEEISLHGALLRSYRIEGRERSDIDGDDGYLFDHLAYHLNIASPAELRNLFTSDTWMKARVLQSDGCYDGYLEDLEIAWTRARETAKVEINSGTVGDGFVDCIRYALIRANTGSAAATFLPSVLARGIELKVIPLDRALSMIRNMPDPGQRIDCIAAVLDHGSLKEAGRIRVSRMAIDEVNRSDKPIASLRQIGRGLHPELLPEALAILQRAFDRELMDVGNAVGSLSSHLDESQVRSVLDFIDGLPAKYYAHSPKHASLKALIPFVSPTILPRISAIALASFSSMRSETLCALLPRLDSEHWQQVFDAALNEVLSLPIFEPEYGRCRAEQMTYIMPFLSSTMADSMSEFVYSDLLKTEEPEKRLTIIRAFGRYFSSRRILDVVAMTRALPEKTSWGGPLRLVAIGALLPRLQHTGSNYLTDEAFELVLSSGSGISELAPALSGQLANRFIERAKFYYRKSREPIWEVRALLPYLSANRKVELLSSYDLPKVMAVCWEAPLGNYEEELLRRVVRDLPTAVFDQIFSAIVSQPDPGGMWLGGRKLQGWYGGRDRNIMQLAFRCSECQVEECTRSRPSQDYHVLMQALSKCLPPFSIDNLELLRYVACRIEATIEPHWEDSYIASLSLVAQYLGPHQIAAHLDRVENCEFHRHRVYGAIRLLPYLPNDLRSRAIELATQKTWALDRTDWHFPLCLASIIPFLEGHSQEAAIADFLDTLDLGRGGYLEALRDVIPLFDKKSLQRALTIAVADGHGDSLVRQIVERLSGQMSDQELRSLYACLEVSDLLGACVARIELAAKLPDKLASAWNSVWRWLHHSGQDHLLHLSDCYSRLVSHVQDEHLPMFIEATSMYSGFRLPHALSVLAPRLAGPQKDAILDRLAKMFLSGTKPTNEVAMSLEVLARAGGSVKSIRHGFLDGLYRLQPMERTEALGWLAQGKLLEAVQAPETCLHMIGQLIVEVYFDWQWV